MLAVYLKDFKAYFSSFTAYIFMGVFLFITGIFFALSNIMSRSADYNGVLASITFIFILVVPILTMRIMSEEVSQKTDVLLLTTPLSLTGIVVGKYLAAVSVFLITLLITSLYPVILSFFGTIAVWEIIGGTIGFFFLGCAFIAVGLFVSSLTENQVNSAIATFGAMLILMIFEWIQQALPMERNAGMIFAVLIVLAIALWIYLTIRNIALSSIIFVFGFLTLGLLYYFNPSFYDGLMFRFFNFLSLIKYYAVFQFGILSFTSIIYYLSFSTVFLFLTVRILEKKRWA